MKTKHLKLTALLLAIAMMLFACAGCSSNTETDYTTGSPWLNPMVPGNITADMEIDLKDHYVAAVYQEEFLNMTIADGSAMAGTTTDRQNEVHEQLQQLMAEGDRDAGYDAALVMDLYDMYLDWDQRDALGMDPIRADVAAIEAIETIDDLNAYQLATATETITDELCALSTIIDPNDATRRIIDVDSPALLLSDSEMYRKTTATG